MLNSGREGQWQTGVRAVEAPGRLNVAGEWLRTEAELTPMSLKLVGAMMQQQFTPEPRQVFSPASAYYSMAACQR